MEYRLTKLNRRYETMRDKDFNKHVLECLVVTSFDGTVLKQVPVDSKEAKKIPTYRDFLESQLMEAEKLFKDCSYDKTDIYKTTSLVESA